MNELNVPMRGRSSLAGCLAVVLVMGWVQPAAIGQDGFETPRPVPPMPHDASGDAGRSISTSEQFIIYGKTLSIRVPFSVFAEKVKDDYLNLIYRKGRGVAPKTLDGWNYPIVIQVREEESGRLDQAVTTRIRQLKQGGFRLELTARVGDDFKKEALRRELLRLLLAESILRDHKSIRVGSRTELLPTWLMAAVVETLGHPAGGRSNELYEKVFKTGRSLTVEEILSTDPHRLDSVSLTIFELSSAGLLQTLLDQPTGGNRLRSFISDLAIHSGSQRDLLIRHFPGLRASSNSLEKWWALQMASMSQPGVFDTMTPEETDAALTKSLYVQLDATETTDGPTLAARSADGANTPKKTSGIARVSNKVLKLFRPNGGNGGNGGGGETDATKQGAEEDGLAFSCAVEEVDRYFGHPNRKDALNAVQLRLARLSHRGHPLFRQVIHDYQKLIGRMATGDRDRASEEFATLAGRRTLIQRQATAIADHLDSYLLNQNDAPSGKFEKFHQSVEEIEKAGRPGRKDPISRYLDALEEEFK